MSAHEVIILDYQVTGTEFNNQGHPKHMNHSDHMAYDDRMQNNDKFEVYLAKIMFLNLWELD